MRAIRADNRGSLNLRVCGDEKIAGLAIGIWIAVSTCMFAGMERPYTSLSLPRASVSTRMSAGWKDGNIC